MGDRQRWTAEYGTLWVYEPANGLPPLCPARVETTFEEVAAAGIPELAAAMKLATPEMIEQRFRAGRRCFVLKIDGRIATYGWVTHGREFVGELERYFYLQDDEAYIWHCGTVDEWRGRHCYSALLSHLVHRLQEEKLARIWIGASRLNQPSVRGFVNAGFQPVINCTYRRLFRFTFLWFDHLPSAERPLVAAAYRIMLNQHERRFGRLAVGILPQNMGQD